jgi:hypothetical protein
MKKRFLMTIGIFWVAVTMGCSTSYKATPLPFKTPSAYKNATTVAGAMVAADEFSDSKKATEAFGFDIRGAGLLPVQIVFDHQGQHPIEINGEQTFLEDAKGNLWPILNTKIAYERATKYAQTQTIFKEGAYSGFLGATAGSIIGAAIGVVTGEDILSTVGKGAAVGAATGATLGGAGAYGSDDARRAIIDDLREKSLKNKVIEPNNFAHGFLFFPGEAGEARRLRLQLVEKDSNNVHVLNLSF